MPGPIRFLNEKLSGNDIRRMLKCNLGIQSPETNFDHPFIANFGRISDHTGFENTALTYITDEAYLDQFIQSDYIMALCPYSMALSEGKPIHLKHGKALIGVGGIDVISAFYLLWEVVVAQIETEDSRQLPAVWPEYFDSNGYYSNSPYSIIHDTTIIKEESTIGGEGFQRFGNQLLTHTGFVCIEKNCRIGSNVCIDRGLFGTSTYLDEGVFIDNHVHIGHNCEIGKRVTITAGVVLAGSTIIEDDVWVGIGSTIKGHVGHDAYIGMGSNVVNPVPPHALVYGNPAKVRGWVCCQKKMELVSRADFGEFCSFDAICKICGKKYIINPTRQTCWEEVTV